MRADEPTIDRDEPKTIAHLGDGLRDAIARFEPFAEQIKISLENVTRAATQLTRNRPRRKAKHIDLLSLLRRERYTQQLKRESDRESFKRFWRKQNQHHPLLVEHTRHDRRIIAKRWYHAGKKRRAKQARQVAKAQDWGNELITEYIDGIR